MYTKRDELDVQLNIIEGEIPDDIYGVFYVSYPVGSVNSGGLPFPKNLPDGSNNNEYASPIMNGDGMVLKIDLNNLKNIQAKTRLMKTPCYWADYNTRYGTKNINPLIPFKNFGISRMSLMLGARNELNTAIIPIKFKNQKNSSLLASYDVGRPYVLDANSLELKTAVGALSEWIPATPPFIKWPFPLIQTSAHPTFDAETQELFTVNYTRSMQSMMANEKVINTLSKNPEMFEKELEKRIRLANVAVSDEEKEKLIREFFENLEKYVPIDAKNTLVNVEVDEKSWLGKRIENIVNFVKKYLKKLLGSWLSDEIKKVEDEFKTFNNVYLMQWDGGNVINKWMLMDEFNQPIVISECMHQTSITKDYIFLTDCAFKFSLDLLVNNPFQHNPVIDEALRWLIARPMVPYTKGYIIKRRELQKGKKSIRALMMKESIPLESIHYDCEFENKNNIITLYAVHNTATCIAEWVRSFDKNKITGTAADPELMGMFAVGCMDITRFGKWQINGETGEIKQSDIFCEEGKWRDKNLGANTWGLGLFTYRDMISATKNAATIDTIYFTSNGVDDRLLTQFIYDLYEKYDNRIVPLHEMLEVAKRGVPFSITMLDTKSMKALQYFQLEKYEYIRGLHFIPRKVAKTDNYSIDGYLFCSMQVGKVISEGVQYQSEFWIFDASNIEKGPIAKLFNEEIIFCFTLHTAWLEEAINSDLPYNIDTREDINEVINKLILTREEVQIFFDKNVYPHFQ